MRTVAVTAVLFSDEYGGRYGPSLMRGGTEKAWIEIKNIFLDILAKNDSQPRCDWIGSGSSGHYFKMLPNRIEQ